MHIISHKRLKEFWLKHPDAEPALHTWYIRTTLAQSGRVETHLFHRRSSDKVDRFQRWWQ